MSTMCKKEEGLERRMRESEGKCCGAGWPRPVDFLSAVLHFRFSSGLFLCPRETSNPSKSRQDVLRKGGVRRRANSNTGVARHHFSGGGVGGC